MSEEPPAFETEGRNSEERTSEFEVLTSDETLIVDVGGFEGPLDLLLQLARSQKVDLARISIVALVEQYLDFIESAKLLRLELAADYLVMAAWLAYLKSRLLMPKRKDDGAESGEELAAVLQFRLQRLEAMRQAAERLMERQRLGRDVFARGAPERAATRPQSTFSASLYDLLTAYAVQRQRRAVTQVKIARRTVWPLKEARELLMRLLGRVGDWTALDRFLIEYACPPGERRSALASSFAASLELAREGDVEIRQEGAFEELYMRSKPRARKLSVVS